ncbi:beta-glucosidase/6-phospho-beta-glucosidase/beta-galactosidase/ABC-type amino acid transport substrate-binding protein [Haloferula luteola]|uniref:Beta-glucosidase/6-phospho-beta-glucosidase/beta-galactosidase/ABC-type amino acid transport substrate-binding protein n=1 Tax=Haloferula luteola TaxID=595692 RepID=A0A840V3E4_9BACT|nr:family 1 glycosylhydrolase [Haloferula luteola]MBB5352502.1 beta-glucosidase/6-phospho-beta-glucosidase/beta-galactosidase/ABC-type amino acid transport substrate-binding protein [Haloferula luteola]
MVRRVGFPADFLFGTANADHQVEAHDPGREDVWDLWERCQERIPRGRATDFAHRYEEDIGHAAAMGCRLFRFSIAWSRVEPECGRFDAEVLAHYRRVAECVERHGMQVMVTLHHFVWPLWLERDHGGMIGEAFPDLFARYADRVAEVMGDRVDWWITFNEPSQLTFGYIKPWWQSRYYMPPGMPRGASVDSEAKAVGKLVPNLFRAHARARRLIHSRRPGSPVGVNPLVTGFPVWLQKLMDWGACHRALGEALFKFTTRRALVSEKSEVDLVIGGISAADQTRFEISHPYVRTGKAVVVRSEFRGEGKEALNGLRVGVVDVGNQAESWRRDLPADAQVLIFSNYDEARSKLRHGGVEALYGDAFYLMPEGVNGLRVLLGDLTEEHYVVAAAHGHARLMERVNRAIAGLRGEEGDWPDHPGMPPTSVHEVFRGGDSLPDDLSSARGVRRVKRRGFLRMGFRRDAAGLSADAPAPGLEMKLARRIAAELLGDPEAVEWIPLDPAERLTVLESKSTWLNWAWRFWGTTSLIANASWWYLGTSGRLPEELCPAEAVGAQDFIGLDYYWGLPTFGLHRFRLLEEAAHGRFLRAPVWPRGLRNALRRLSGWFPGQELLIVENGCPPEAGGMKRGDYMDAHLREVHAALEEGLPVRAYNWWSITSNREWGHAFDPNTDFGLYFVDLDHDPALRRVATPEVERYRQWIAGERS